MIITSNSVVVGKLQFTCHSTSSPHCSLEIHTVVQLLSTHSNSLSSVVDFFLSFDRNLIVTFFIPDTTTTTTTRTRTTQFERKENNLRNKQRSSKKQEQKQKP
jgi:hypothetical protein